MKKRLLIIVFLALGFYTNVNAQNRVVVIPLTGEKKQKELTGNSNTITTVILQAQRFIMIIPMVR